VLRPGRFTPRKDPVPIVHEAGWAPGPVWTGAEYLTPTRIRSPDRAARSQSLYRLSYRPYILTKQCNSKQPLFKVKSCRGQPAYKSLIRLNSPFSLVCPTVVRVELASRRCMNPSLREYMEGGGLIEKSAYSIISNSVTVSPNYKHLLPRYDIWHLRQQHIEE
jgi:hypothetical protein